MLRIGKNEVTRDAHRSCPAQERCQGKADIASLGNGPARLLARSTNRIDPGPFHNKVEDLELAPDPVRQRPALHSTVASLRRSLPQSGANGRISLTALVRLPSALRQEGGIGADRHHLVRVALALQ